jgi:hypothetical protein
MPRSLELQTAIDVLVARFAVRCGDRGISPCGGARLFVPAIALRANTNTHEAKGSGHDCSRAR